MTKTGFSYKNHNTTRTVFRFAQKACAEKIYRGERVFLKEKSTIFLSKKHARPKETLFGRFLSEAKKGSNNYHEFL